MRHYVHVAMQLVSTAMQQSLTLSPIIIATHLYSKEMMCHHLDRRDRKVSELVSIRRRIGLILMNNWSPLGILAWVLLILDQAASLVSGYDVEWMSDLHGSGEYRKAMAAVLARRAIRLALQRASA